MKKEKFTDSEKEAILYELYNTTKPQSTIAKEFNISVTTIRKWRKEKELDENPPKRKYFKIIEKVGIILLILTFIFIYFDKPIIAIFLLMFATLFQIPEDFYFIKNLKNERMYYYHLSKYIGLIFITIILIYGIIKIVKN